METQTKAFIEGLKAVIAPFDTLTWFGGIGSEVARIRELRYSFREADKAFAGRFVQEPNQIISVEQLNFEQQDNEFDANIFGEPAFPLTTAGWSGRIIKLLPVS